ncbi:MAG: two-component sensor histidine kinase [Streptosporangiales bacterium]|nr:two-component sensor histidine kinase [Streptosporangiales bacterium]
MEMEVVAGLAGLVGILVGATAALAVRLSERSQTPTPPANQGTLPPGIASVLAVLPSSAVVLDSDDRVLRASSAARAFGLVRGDRLVVGELLQLARRVRRDGEIRETSIDVPQGRFGHETACFAVRIAPLGPWGLVLVLAEDQTELRRVEAVRRDFVANVSHELKTPVGALALLAETIEGAADDPDAVRRFTGRMQHEATRLTNLVQELIILSRIQGGEPIPKPQPVALDDVVAEAVDRCRMKANSKEIQLVIGGSEYLTVMGDEDLLATALRNLIDNAVAYSPERTRVAISTRRAGDLADISVSDQGFGIPEHELERIFERFYRVDPARSRATGGTGLGLAIVKHVATTHGGEVKVWSKENFGSTFTLRLPVHHALQGYVYGPGEPAGSRKETLREARS